MTITQTRKLVKVNCLGLQRCEVCETSHRRGYDVSIVFGGVDWREKEYLEVFTCSIRCADMWILSRI